MGLWDLLTQYWYIPLFFAALLIYPANGVSWLVSSLHSRGERQLTAKSQRTWERWLSRSWFMSPSVATSDADLDELYAALQQAGSRWGLRYGTACVTGGVVGIGILLIAWPWLSGPQSAWLSLAAMSLATTIASIGGIWGAMSLPTRRDLSFESEGTCVPPLGRLWTLRWPAVLMLLPGLAVSVILVYLTVALVVTPHAIFSDLSAVEPVWYLAVTPLCLVGLAASEAVSLVRMTTFPAFPVGNEPLSRIASLTWKAEHLNKTAALIGVLGIAQWHLLYPTNSIDSSPILVLCYLTFMFGAALGMGALDIAGTPKRRRNYVAEEG